MVLGLALLTACSTGTTGPHDADDGLSLEETGTVATELIDGLQAQVDPTLVASVETQEDGAAAIGGRRVAKVIHAGGGRLVNIVTRD